MIFTRPPRAGASARRGGLQEIVEQRTVRTRHPRRLSALSRNQADCGVARPSYIPGGRHDNEILPCALLRAAGGVAAPVTMGPPKPLP